MLSQSVIQKILDLGLSRGCDFAEVFVEESESSSIRFLQQKVDQVTSHNTFGIGIRLLYGNECTYGYSSDASEDTLLKLTSNLTRDIKDNQVPTARAFDKVQNENSHPVQIDPNRIPKNERVELLRQLDELTRKEGSAVCQVQASTGEKQRSVLIANSEGLWVEDTSHYSRLSLEAIADSGDGPQTAGENPGRLGGYEVFQSLDLTELAHETGQRAIRMAKAGYIEGGLMPVIIGNGFGGVIFHEACGHPLETEAIRRNASPFVGKIGKPVAQAVLTAIDDGTLEHHWGSLNIDDEGYPAQRTVLIENGILKSYLADRIGAHQVGVPQTGSGRRESYKFAPVSRMRNTYIDKGPHNLEEMLASVDYGLYAKKMGGGSVNPSTGEFNFSVQEGYILRNGKVMEAVRGATLIGKGHEVLPRISMVGQDLELAAGTCGASSGLVPTTVGQPTLKVDSILVGGR